MTYLSFIGLVAGYTLIAGVVFGGLVNAKVKFFTDDWYFSSLVFSILWPVTAPAGGMFALGYFPVNKLVQLYRQKQNNVNLAVQRLVGTEQYRKLCCDECFDECFNDDVTRPANIATMLVPTQGARRIYWTQLCDTHYNAISKDRYSYPRPVPLNHPSELPTQIELDTSEDES